MPLDDSAHPLEIAGQQRPQRLRIRLLPERGGAGHVAEQDRDRLEPLAAVTVSGAAHSPRLDDTFGPVEVLPIQSDAP